MIKNIFLPEKIGNNYLFAKRIVGIDINTTHVHATQVYAKGTMLTIERAVEQVVESGDHNERIIEALKILITKLNNYQEIRSAIPSAHVVFKTLKLPFTAYDKINLIINFEVEPLLPFSLDDAIIDFIITKIHPQENSAEVLVAAVQKQYIAQHLELLAQAGINPQVITVDLFALYGLYNAIPQYAEQRGNVALIDLRLHDTRIAYIENGQLRLIRTLPKGMSHIAKKISDALSITPAQALDHMLRFGLEKPDWQEYETALKQAYESFWKEIQFTLASCAAQAGSTQTTNTILLLGEGASLKGIASFASNALELSVSLFNIQYITQAPHINIKTKSALASSAIMSAAIALPSETTALFNLRKDEFGMMDTALFYKQFVVTCGLILILLGTLIGYSYWKSSRLAAHVQASEQEARQMLIEQFPKLEEEDSLEDMIEDARTELTRGEKTWVTFASQPSYLKYLLELTERIDKESTGLVIEKMDLTGDTLTLKGQVKDFKALKILERELRQSPLFKSVEPQTDIRFDAMKIKLAANGRGG
ncbi:MAG TPA: type II secretion system protein GspL [Candidatus Dependentiae bacterium]|nr:type II secretion system protein GspL [Candidatus Dependentiae bacterium]HRQ62991.1 type II secretion system protein GspL [Candidatus Dependentiae bacterium]